MAILVAGALGVDSNRPDIGSLRSATPITRESGLYVVRSDVGQDRWVDEFRGEGLMYLSAYPDPLRPVAGLVTGWTETLNGELVFEITDARVEMLTIVNWINGGTSATHVLFSGADGMAGSPQGDTLSGLAGDDTVRGAEGSDSLDGGAGADLLEGGLGSDSVFGGLGNDIISDGVGQNYLRGNEGDDSLSGGADFDDVHGNMGNDTVSGGGGDDWVVGGQDNDLQFGGDGFDIVYGNLGADTVNGDAGNDWVRGGQQNDAVNGGAGDDWLSGDRDNDTVTGGTGADLFNLFAGSGHDRITDFSLAEGDRIRWEGGVPNYIITQVGADTVISWGADQVTLVGVQVSSLTGTAWFIAA